ncbi:MAG TPA: hypothetical protein VFI68_13260 [Anaerolineales bacterium]|nr:hypothetical protein [Anaerolineales bacterium]
MSRPVLNERLAILLIAPLLISLACNTLTGGSSPGSQPENMTIQKDVVYGSGPFNLPDPRAGLSGVSSYKAKLTLSFDGTRNGQSEKWSKTYVMLTQKDPVVRQLTIETTGDLTDLDPVFMAEADGTAYERIGENSCSATQIETGNSLGDRMELASFLNYVIGADEAGSETVNDLAATHYTFNQRALGQQDLTESSGEFWLASDGGYLIRYLLTTKAGENYFGEGIEGTVTFDYEISEVNAITGIDLPDDCPLALPYDIPILPDAKNVQRVIGSISYQTASTPKEVLAFYQEQLPPFGWVVSEGSPEASDTSGYIYFTQGNKTMIITSDAGETGTYVRIVVGSSSALNNP